MGDAELLWRGQFGGELPPTYRAMAVGKQAAMPGHGHGHGHGGGGGGRVVAPAGAAALSDHAKWVQMRGASAHSSDDESDGDSDGSESESVRSESDSDSESESESESQASAGEGGDDDGYSTASDDLDDPTYRRRSLNAHEHAGRDAVSVGSQSSDTSESSADAPSEALLTLAADVTRGGLYGDDHAVAALLSGPLQAATLMCATHTMRCGLLLVNGPRPVVEAVAAASNADASAIRLAAALLESRVSRMHVDGNVVVVVTVAGGAGCPVVEVLRGMRGAARRDGAQARPTPRPIAQPAPMLA